ncbi:hypothetical protein GQ457_07G043100 [Hibiscus cannabinus]
MSGSDSDSASFALKDTRKTQVMEGGGEAPPGDSGIKFCTYCGRGFRSNKALYGHLRVHSVTPARPKTGILRINSPKRETKGSDEEDEGFGCFVCSRSFTTMQLLCRHMGIHRGTVSNGVQQQPATSEESNNVSLSEAETTLKLGFPGNGDKVDFLKNVPSWSQHGKRGWKRSATDSHPAALRFYHGAAEPEHLLMQRELSPNTVELSHNWLKKLETQKNCRSGHGRRSMKNAAAMAVKNLHQCEICGGTFATGQALGGHKTFHRKLKLVQTKTEQGQCGEVKEYVTRMLLPEEVPPKKMLDFDLNVPYQDVSDTASFALKDNRETQVMEKGGGRHMGIHRGTVSNGVQQQPATSEESNNFSLSEAETALKLGFESRAFPVNGRKVDFLKDVPSWSQHGRTAATDGDVILYAAPLLFFFYHGAAEPEHPLMQRELSPNTVETQNKSRSGHGRRSMKNAAAKAVKNLHRCEICGGRHSVATKRSIGS